MGKSKKKSKKKAGHKASLSGMPRKERAFWKEVDAKVKEEYL